MKMTLVKISYQEKFGFTQRIKLVLIIGMNSHRLYFLLNLSSVVQQAGSGKSYACAQRQAKSLYISNKFLLKMAYFNHVFCFGSNLQKWVAKSHTSFGA